MNHLVVVMGAVVGVASNATVDLTITLEVQWVHLHHLCLATLGGRDTFLAQTLQSTPTTMRVPITGLDLITVHHTEAPHTIAAAVAGVVATVLQKASI